MFPNFLNSSRIHSKSSSPPWNGSVGPGGVRLSSLDMVPRAREYNETRQRPIVSSADLDRHPTSSDTAHCAKGGVAAFHAVRPVDVWLRSTAVLPPREAAVEEESGKGWFEVAQRGSRLQPVLRLSWCSRNPRRRPPRRARRA